MKIFTIVHYIKFNKHLYSTLYLDYIDYKYYTRKLLGTSPLEYSLYCE